MDDAQVARVWPIVERLVAEAQVGMWNSSQTCDLILSRYLGLHDTSRLADIRDALDGRNA